MGSTNFSFFLFKIQTLINLNFLSEFQSSTVSYNLESRTIPLDDVFFPSTVICNMNTLRRSFVMAILEDEAIKVRDQLQSHLDKGWNPFQKGTLNNLNEINLL